MDKNRVFPSPVTRQRLQVADPTNLLQMAKAHLPSVARYHERCGTDIEITVK
jgi:hypothetical protein